MKYRVLAKFLRHQLSYYQWSYEECVHYMGGQEDQSEIRKLKSWLNGDALPKEQEIDRLAQAFAVHHNDLQVLIDGDLMRIKQKKSHIREFDPYYYLGIRLIPAVHQRTRLPDGLTEMEAIQYVSQYAKRIQRSAYLDCPSGMIHWFSDTGVLYASRAMKAPRALFEVKDQDDALE